MIKRSLSLLLLVLIIACKGDPEVKEASEIESDSIKEKSILSGDLLGEDRVEFTVKEANNLAELPLNCINTQYPNKLGQTLENKEAIGEPQELHPAFYGCFDWHSSVHAHWSMVSLLKQFPDLKLLEKN